MESIWVREYGRWIPTGYQPGKAERELERTASRLFKLVDESRKLDVQINNLTWVKGPVVVNEYDDEEQTFVRRKLTEKQRVRRKALLARRLRTNRKIAMVSDAYADYKVQLSGAKAQRMAEAHARVMLTPEWCAAADRFARKTAAQEYLNDAVEYSRRMQAGHE